MIYYTCLVLKYCRIRAEEKGSGPSKRRYEAPFFCVFLIYIVIYVVIYIVSTPISTERTTQAPGASVL